MMLLLNLSLLVAAFVLLVPVAVFCVECLAAVLPGQTQQSARGPSPAIAVLVPAHNEEIGISATLAALLPQLNPPDRLVVIADNCDDETAAIAHKAGATVIERHDQERRGKGYALDYGLTFLASHPPDVVVVVDADCTVEAGAIEQIAHLAMTRNRPVQATYLLAQPKPLKPKDAVSALAFRVKNLVRPLGLDRLGLPCLLTGTGMAFPWAVLQQTSLASGNIVEDMKLALDLAIAGHPPLFCQTARVTGVLPQQDQAATSQRTRWEHGHLQTLMTQVPRLLKAAIQQGRFDLLAIALDLSVPPLSLLVMLWGAITMAAIALLPLSGFMPPAIFLGLQGCLLLLSILLAWAKFASSEVPLTTLLSVPLYVLWKIPLYLAFLVKPQTKWVRTARDGNEAINPQDLKG